MSRRRKGELPRYRLHKQSGQAVVSLPLGGNKHRDVLLGRFDSPESKKEYTRVINEWLAAGMLASPKPVAGRCPDLSVAEVCLRFWKHADAYYRRVDSSPSGEIDNYQHALEFLLDLYGPTPISEFGPLKLKAVRQAMIDTYRHHVRFTKDDQTWERWVGRKRIRPRDGREGEWEAESKKEWLPVEVLQKKKAICRKEINRRVELIRRMFRWAVSEELVLASVYQALMAVKGLRRGHPGTYERPKVSPVPQAHVDAVLPFLCPQVAAMVKLQPLIGARETEICLMRGRDIDRTGPVWWYRIDPNEVARDGQPANLHKTAHVEGADGAATVKRLPIGPKAQAILKEWLRDDEDEFLFQPREARRKKYDERRERRKTPLWPSHVAHQAGKKKTQPKRAPRSHYDHHSYARAIARACKKAGVPHEAQRFGGLFLLAATMQAGCDSKSKGTADGDPAKPKAADKDDSKPGVGTKNTSTSTDSGKATTAKGGTEPASGKAGGALIKTATELTRLERKGFVIFYKGFSEEQMEKLVDLLFRQGTGKEPRREFDYGLFSYQAKIAKSNQGMRIVREDDFTTIMVPVEPRLSKSAQHYSALVVGVLFNLHKIDESVRGKS